MEWSEAHHRVVFRFKILILFLYLLNEFLIIMFVFGFFQDIERERKKRDNLEAMDEDIEEEDVAEIKAAHFEESMKYARRS